MTRSFYLIVLIAFAAHSQSDLALQAFGPFNAHWKGVFKVYSYHGQLLDELEVEQRYWWEGDTQMATFIERYRDGRVVKAQARNYIKDGSMYCEVKKDTGEETVHLGHYENGTLFWYRKTPDNNTIESFKERVVKNPAGKAYFIDGFGVYGQGDHASYFLFEGRYEEVPE